MEWDDLIGRLRAVLLDVEPQLLPTEVQMIWELVDVGEPAVAFEMLCTQLYEHDAGVNSDVVKRLADLGEAMNLRPRQWEILRVAD
ncbi:MafI family immunity protein [Kribbella sp. NPDC050124]|uniref:MafI family immunity protein n=1 Tax=Kribbella sp. NPDC050124 TaxID=3364114 RepID=UPI0037BCD779